MADMLVRLYKFKEDRQIMEALEAEGIRIKQALAPDMSKVTTFAEKNFSLNWADECRAAFSNHPVSCYLAVKDRRIIGFACYDCTAKGFFGPIGVLEEFRGRKIGTALLGRCLTGLWNGGYAYAIIGWPNEPAKAFYAKAAGATVIEDSTPGIYGHMVSVEN